MVYRSFGRDITQEDIWPAIAKKNRLGSLASTTHLMAKDALSRGFAAIAFQSRHPIQALRLCCESGTRAILNHRAAPDSTTGHYSVLVGMDDHDVMVHDPFRGPSRRIPHAELVELWRPGFPNSEITGYVLIGIAAESPAESSCWLCRALMPSAAVCPGCQQPVSLRPSGPLGCTAGSCVARMWNYICCPSCDCGFTIGAESVPVDQVQPESPGAQAPAALPGPMDLTPVFAEIDKFCSHVLTIPGAAEHPQIRQCLDAIAANNEKLKLAGAQSLLHQRAHQEQLAMMTQTAEQVVEAHRKKLEELNTSSAPLDGNLLGRALMKNLGLLR
jgi:hypothetical protein